jgi:hypothetical protein
VEVAGVEQSPTDGGGDATLEQDVVGQHHRGPAAWLLVGRGRLEIIASDRLLVAGDVARVGDVGHGALGPERRGGQDHVVFGNDRVCLARGRRRCATPRPGCRCRAATASSPPAERSRRLVQSRSAPRRARCFCWVRVRLWLPLTHSWAGGRNPAVPQAGSAIISPGAGRITETIASMIDLGVKYCPAPDLVSSAPRCNSARVAIRGISTPGGAQRWCLEATGARPARPPPPASARPEGRPWRS